MSNLQVTQEGDVYLLQFFGQVDGPTMEKARDHLVKLKDLPEAIMVVDVSKMDGLTPEARKVVSDLNVRWRYRSLVVCGGSFGMRAMILIIVRGLSLVGKFDPSIHTFKDLESARVWLGSLAPYQAAG